MLAFSHNWFDASLFSRAVFAKGIAIRITNQQIVSERLEKFEMNIEREVDIEGKFLMTFRPIREPKLVEYHCVRTTQSLQHTNKAAQG